MDLGADILNIINELNFFIIVRQQEKKIQRLREKWDGSGIWLIIFSYISQNK